MPGHSITPTNSAERLDRLIRTAELLHLVGLSRSSIWRMQRLGTFPRPRKVGSRAIAWSSAEVQQWIESRSRTSGVER
jgi:prophage regulatory protein